MTALQVLLIGLGLAGYYALVAIGFALIFATVRVFHIAHGTVFLTAGYFFFLLYRVLELPILLSGLVGIGVATLLGLAIDRAIYLPVLRRGGGLFSVFIASLGIALVFEAIFLVWSKGVTSVARTGNLEILEAGRIVVRVIDLVNIAVVALVCGAIHLWLHRTSTGLKVRALTDNAPLAAVVGVNIGRTRDAIFLVASALAGVAGVFTTYDTGITPDAGLRVLFIGVVAVILGGVRNLLLGTIVGSLSLGILTAYAGFLFPTWVTLSIFLMMILLLLFRPQGVFG
jgi:branched-chain amino acid transport system permease protein